MTKPKLTPTPTPTVTVSELGPQAAYNISVADIASAVVKLSNWKTYVIYGLIGLSVVLGGVALWQRGTIANNKVALVEKKAEIETLKVERDLAKANETACRTSVENQNKRITEQGEQYRKLSDDMAELGEGIARSIAEGKAYRKSQSTREQATPKTCEETLDFLNKNTQP